MTEQILYNLKTASKGSIHTYVITKFDNDFNIESSYEVSYNVCTCPQSNRPTCRHRKMLPLFLATERIDTNWFLNFETKDWTQVGNDEQSLEAQDISIASYRELEPYDNVAIELAKLVKPQPALKADPPARETLRRRV